MVIYKPMTIFQPSLTTHLLPLTTHWPPVTITKHSLTNSILQLNGYYICVVISLETAQPWVKRGQTFKAFFKTKSIVPVMLHLCLVTNLCKSLCWTFCTIILYYSSNKTKCTIWMKDSAFNYHFSQVFHDLKAKYGTYKVPQAISRLRSILWYTTWKICYS